MSQIRTRTSSKARAQCRKVPIIDKRLWCEVLFDFHYSIMKLDIKRIHFGSLSASLFPLKPGEKRPPRMGCFLLTRIIISNEGMACVCVLLGRERREREGERDRERRLREREREREGEREREMERGG